MPWFHPGWFVQVFTKNYCNAQGRANRSEFWSFYFYAVIASLFLRFFDNLNTATPFPVFTAIFFLAIMIPTVCLQIRRLHDMDTTGWCVLLCFIPFIGTIALIAIGVISGTSGDNRFGPVPVRLSVK